MNEKRMGGRTRYLPRLFVRKKADGAVGYSEQLMMAVRNLCSEWILIHAFA